MTADKTAKERVLEVWPDARCVQIIRGKWNVVYGDDADRPGYANIIEPSQHSESKAWGLAASRLPVAAQEEQGTRKHPGRFRWSQTRLHRRQPYEHRFLSRLR